MEAGPVGVLARINAERVAHRLAYDSSCRPRSAVELAHIICRRRKVVTGVTAKTVAHQIMVDVDADWDTVFERQTVVAFRLLVSAWGKLLDESTAVHHL